MKCISRKTAAWGLSLGLAAFLAGCGGGKPLPPPTMTEYSTIVVVPLLTDDPTMGMLAARDLANQVGITLRRSKEDIQLVFDESESRKPVSDAMGKLSLKPEEVYRDAKLAAKLAEELKADVILVSRLTKPNLKTDEDDRPVFDMSNQAGISGTTKFTIIWQQATANLSSRLIANDGNVVWQTGSPPPKEPGDVSVYLKYAKAYQSQVPDKPPIAEDVILAHVRDVTWRILAHELMPTAFPEIKVPVWKEKPENQFKTSGGIVKFE